MVPVLAFKARMHVVIKQDPMYSVKLTTLTILQTSYTPLFMKHFKVTQGTLKVH